MIRTVVVGCGLAGRYFHVPLILRVPRLRLHGIVSSRAEARAEATRLGDDVRGYPTLDGALGDDAVELVVIATPHNTHADLVIQTLEAGKHCVVDKVMALSTSEADRMIAARDASGKVLSVFHNRRWDWDYLTARSVIASGQIGRPMIVESSVCRHAPPRAWRGRRDEAGTILHDWGAHLVDQALQFELGPCRRLTAWITPAPWPGVDTGGHGKIVLEFDDNALFHVETSRIAPLDKPRWWIVGTRGAFIKYGVDPQEDALRAGDIDAAVEPPENIARIRFDDEGGTTTEHDAPTVRGHWDSYYANVADHIAGEAELAVTAEHGREVVRVLEAAEQSAREQRAINGPWGT